MFGNTEESLTGRERSQGTIGDKQSFDRALLQGVVQGGVEGGVQGGVEGLDNRWRRLRHLCGLNRGRFSAPTNYHGCGK